MPSFQTTRRVEFGDTDMAGIVHFANFFRYMEAAETEFLRTLGFSVAWHYNGQRVGFPRVSAACDYVKPAKFGDLLTVTVSIEKVGRKSVTYRFAFTRGADSIATGRITSVFCHKGDDGAMKSVELPPEIRAKLEG